MARKRRSRLPDGFFQAVYSDTGQVIEGAIIRFVNEAGDKLDAVEFIEELRDTIANLHDELDRKLARIRKMQSDQDAQLHNSPHYKAALDVLRFWRDHCHPNAVEIENGDRVRCVISRMSGRPPYTVQMLKDCVLGYAAFPYVVDGRRMSTGTPARRFVDATLIFRDAKHVDSGIALHQESQRRRQEMPAVKADQSPKVVDLSALGQAAVKLANYGWYVFPLMPKDKIPLPGSNGFKDATREIGRIERFWARNPQHNIGIRCGIDSGLVVMDVDGEEGYATLRALERHFGALPKTASVVTPRGGQHFYFVHPGRGEVRNTTGFPGPGLDIRGDGGYVLGPPSEGSNGKCYEVDEAAAPAPIPQWLLELLLKRQSQPRALNRDYAQMVRQGVAKGERNSQLLSLAGHFWSHDHTPEQVFEFVYAVNLAKCKPPLSAREVNSIVASVGRMRARQALRDVTGHKESDAA